MNLRHWRMVADRGAMEYAGLAARLAMRPSAGGAAPAGFRVEAAYNPFGDRVLHWPEPSRYVPRERIEFEWDLAVLDGQVERLNRFARLCGERGARVFHSYPPQPVLSPFPEELAPELDRLLRQRLIYPVISQPESYRFSDELFFDTHYHLRGAGPMLGARQLAQDLRPFLLPESEPGDQGGR
jgi:hypothetical protein